jgi:transmembrane protein 173
MPYSRAEENNGFGPIYEPRGQRSMYFSGFILVLYLGFTFFLERKNESLRSWHVYLFAFGFSVFAVLIGEAVRRFCLFTEEYRHLDARYEGSFKKVVYTSFGFKNGTVVCLLAGMVIVIAVVFCSVNDWTSFNFDYMRLFLLNALFMPIFVFMFGLREPSRVEYSQNSEKENKNLADGLAWSFYFGYLKFVLPALAAQINATEMYRYKIEVQKLFIVLPKNCQVFEKISNDDSDPNKLVEDVGNLAPLKKNRGGIQDRVYKHTVHCIKEKKPNGEVKKLHYCVMEYATPLMTLHDMSIGPNIVLSEQEKDQQVVLFIRKLKKILDEDPECKGKYELITFSGQAGQDIGEIVIRALTNPTLEIGT